MKPNAEYVRKLLLTFRDSPNPWPSIGEIERAGFTIDGQFVLHLELLRDYGFVEGSDGDNRVGILGIDGTEVLWNNSPLRLTARGHEFADALGKSEIWNMIKEKFRDASIQSMADAAREAVGALTKIAVGAYLSAAP